MKKKLSKESVLLHTVSDEARKKIKINSNFSETDILKLVHELELRQIKLEVQNDELILANQMSVILDEYSTIYDNAPVGYFTFSRIGEITKLNILGAKMLNRTRLRLVGARFGFFVSSDTRETFNLFLQQIFFSKVKQTCELILLVDDIKSYYHLSGIVSKKETECTIIMVDITDYKKMEILLYENNIKMEKQLLELKDVHLSFNNAMEVGNVSWWKMEIDTGNITFGKQKAEMLGYNPSQFKYYTDFTKLIHPDDYNNVMNTMREHIKGITHKYEVEYRILNNLGEYVWFYDVGSIVIKSDGELPNIVSGFVLNINKIKLVENDG